MVVHDHDGVLDVDDLPEGEPLLRASPRRQRGRPKNLVGHPLDTVERYYVEQALELTDGNREEAAKMLDIGEPPHPVS